jgi:hypothetical protein
MERSVVAAIKQRYTLMQPVFNERSRRRWLAAEAQALSRGGIAAVTQATGSAPNTIRAGLRELASEQKQQQAPLPPERIRRPGGGRKALTDKDTTLQADLDCLIEPVTRGDPISPLRWVCKSVRKLSATLQDRGHQVHYTTVTKLLHHAGFRLKTNRKTAEGTKHPDRNGQFHYISNQAIAFQETGQPVISVDSKKRELIGNYANKGEEWEPPGHTTDVNTHDFPDKELGKVTPYGVYDLKKNEGWVSVGIDHNTAQFAVNSIRRWWHEMGQERYPKVTKLLITADAGGSNGYRTRLWKYELQQLVNELRMPITVCHFPPGTSKWNQIEHRLFSFISQNWRGRPLLSRAIVVELIGNTTTQAGLKVKAALDERQYAKGIKISDQEMVTLNIKKHDWHGEWNYTIYPQKDYDV